MKTSTSKNGFTLVELLVALGVTAIIVSMLVAITATALDGYSSSRNQVKASREAQAAFNQFANDLESLVVRSGNENDWLWFSTETTNPGPANNQSPNATRAVFFTRPTDRYNGAINTSNDLGGDVSAVSYRLLYRDPVTNSEDQDFSTFVLYRQIINPDETFENLLGEEDLETAFQQFEAQQSDAENFVCENIYEFTLTFEIEYTENGEPLTERVVVASTGGQGAVDDFRIRGNGILSNNTPGAPFENGTVTTATLSVTVINDTALEILRNSNLSETNRVTLLEKNSFYFAKTILLPRP